jgi:xyloglucan-specific endo-beta-1,4-glucanase
MRVQQMLQLAAMAPLAMAVDLCDQFAYHNEAGWYFNNNEWGSGSGSGDQCTHVDSVGSSGVSWHTEWSWSGGENNVKSYPYSGRELSDKKLVNTIGKIPSGADWSYSGSDIRANVAYDIFTAADPNHEISSGDHELMIW